jgi:hypothetical protein
LIGDFSVPCSGSFFGRYWSGKAAIAFSVVSAMLSISPWPLWTLISLHLKRELKSDLIRQFAQRAQKRRLYLCHISSAPDSLSDCPFLVGDGDIRFRSTTLQSAFHVDEEQGSLRRYRCTESSLPPAPPSPPLLPPSHWFLAMQSS